MANRRVTIGRYAKIDSKWHYVKPTYGRNHQIRAEEGSYYIRWRNGSKMEWQRCHNPVSAEQECRRREAMLTAQAYGIVPPPRNTGSDIPGVTSPALQMVWSKSPSLQYVTLRGSPIPVVPSCFHRDRTGWRSWHSVRARGRAQVRNLRPRL
jgi:hypothetical protein